MLQDRRRNSRMIMLYRVINGLVVIPEYSLTRNSIRNKLQTIRTKSDTHKFSIFPRSIRDWNCLPSRVVIAETVSQCKTELDKVSAYYVLKDTSLLTILTPPLLFGKLQTFTNTTKK